jgi:protein ImuA
VALIYVYLYSIYQPPIEPAAIHYQQQRCQPIAATSLPCTMSPFPLPADENAPALHADVWPAHALAQSATPVQCTGHAALDAELPGAGWPVGALIEVLQAEGLHAEWRLLLPALAACGQGPLALVGPPYVPFAPALAAQGLPCHRLLCIWAQSTAQRLWSAEQLLRCAAVDAVLLWLPERHSAAVRSDALRRLHMAAAQHHKLFFLMRPASAQHMASPAVLRLHLSAQSRPAPIAVAGAPTKAPSGALFDVPPSASPAAFPRAHHSTCVDPLQVHLPKRRGPPLSHGLQLHARCPALQLLLATSKPHALDCTPA